MLFADEKKVRAACAKCMANPRNARAYDELLNGCRSIGRGFLRMYNIVPPNVERMLYAQYDGRGIINFNKSIVEFCSKGKTLDGMVSRQRRRDVKLIRFAVVYDDSNSMTAWWRNKNQPTPIAESDSPQTYAKVACLSMMEGLGRDTEISFWKYGSAPSGPFNMTNNMYREVIASNGSGGSRLDLALQSVLDNGWDRRPGARVMLIITDGVPEIGRSEYAEDVQVTVAALDRLHKLLRHKVQILYLQLMIDEIAKRKRTGGYTLAEFGDEVARLGCNFMAVNAKERIEDSLFKGINTMMKRI